VEIVETVKEPKPKGKKKAGGRKKKATKAVQPKEQDENVGEAVAPVEVVAEPVEEPVFEQAESHPRRSTRVSHKSPAKSPVKTPAKCETHSPAKSATGHTLPMEPTIEEPASITPAKTPSPGKSPSPPKEGSPEKASPVKIPSPAKETSAKVATDLPAGPKMSLGDPWGFKNTSNRSSLAETEKKGRRKTNARKTFVSKVQGPLIADPARRKTTAPAPPPRENDTEKENDPMGAVESIIHEVKGISKHVGSPLVLQPYMAPMGESGMRELSATELDMTLEEFTRLLIEEEKQRLEKEGRRMLDMWKRQVDKVKEMVGK